MTDDVTSSALAPAVAAADTGAGGAFDNLSEADASAVLESLGGSGGGGGGDMAAGNEAAGEAEIPGVGSLDEVLEGADLAKMTDAQVADFESGDPERVEAALAAQMLPRAPGEEGAMGGPARVSIKALKPGDRARTVQALDLIRAGRAPAEAFAEAFGIAAQMQGGGDDDAAAQQAVADPYAAGGFAPVPGAAPQVTELEGRLSTLQQQYREAKETYDPGAADILERITDVKLDLREARRDAAVVSHEWQGMQAESHTRAMAQFADLIADERSGFVPFCDDEILLAQAKGDPMLNEPDWPEKIGRRVMDKFFQGHAAHSPGLSRGASQMPSAPRHAVRLPGSPVGPGFSAGGLSPQTAMAEIDKLTPEQQDAFIRSLDKLTVAKTRR